jgi:putative hydrolases of HD superfamily
MNLDDQKEKRACVNLLNEFSMLSKLPRSGFSFLGTGNQTVADHSYGVLAIAFVLSRCSEEPVDELRLLQLCLFHDLPESRIGDHNYVQKQYIDSNDSKVFKDIENSSSLGKFIVDSVVEFEELKSLEAKLARDADHLELLISLKREIDIGNPRAKEWFDVSEKRLNTEVGKKLAQEIRITPFDEWWLKGILNYNQKIT